MSSFLSISHPDSCFFESLDLPDVLLLPEELVPGFRCEGLGWWTGHPDVTAGSDVFLYVTAPFSAIHFLLVAEENAHEIKAVEDQIWAGKWGFPYEALFYFPDGLTISEMRAMPELAGWSPLRSNFQGTGFELPSGVANAIRKALAAKNPHYAKLANITPAPVCSRCGAAGGPVNGFGFCDACQSQHVKDVTARRAALRKATGLVTIP